MDRSVRRVAVMLVIAGMLLATTRQAKADSIGRAVTLAVTLIAVGGAAVGILIYKAASHQPSLTGCATAGASGLELKNEGDSKTYSLIGDVAGVTAGDRVRVGGKKKKDAPAGQPVFVVEKMKKDFGSCRAMPAKP